MMKHIGGNFSRKDRDCSAIRSTLSRFGDDGTNHKPGATASQKKEHGRSARAGHAGRHNFPSHLHDSDKFNIWKKEERAFIKQNDGNHADTWFLVDVMWLQEWKGFMRKEASYPAPIDNTRLVDKHSHKPNPGLKLIQDYRGVNSAVWNFWQNRYGGGPIVERKQLDLYAADVNATVHEDLDETLVARRPPDPEDNVVLPRTGKQAVQSRSRESTSYGSGSTQSEHSSLPESGGGSSAVPGAGSSVAGSIVGSPAAATAAAEAPPRRQNSNSSSTSSRRYFSSFIPSRVADGGKTTASQNRQPQRSSAASRRRGQSVPVVPARPPEPPSKPACCDKCDGPHVTEECPHFKKPREKHKDAWTMMGKAGRGGGSVDDVPVIKAARVVPQPGDGSCLFHSLSYGLKGRSHGRELRREICDFIDKNPDLEVGDNALKEWISYDSGGSVQSYTSQMASGRWGGGIEMAAFAKMKKANVHVYEKAQGGGFRRISNFECPGAQKTVSVLYQGRAHYDALVL